MRRTSAVSAPRTLASASGCGTPATSCTGCRLTAARPTWRSARVLGAGAEREIYLTWPADKPLLPAAELCRGHVIETVGAGRIRPVSG
jgi:hypothetical protein